MFSEKKLPQAEQKKCRSVGIKHFYSNTYYGFEYKRNWVSKLSIKIFIKRRTRGGKPHAYQMLLSFKTSITFFNFLIFFNCSINNYQIILN